MWYNGQAMGDLGRIGLVAVRREILPLREVLQMQKREWVGDVHLEKGQVGAQPVALAEVLPGPVSGALGAQALIVRCGVESLINFGSAGAVDAALSPGDLVIGQQAVAHDAGVFEGSHFKPSGVIGRDSQGRIGYRRAYQANPELVALALNAARMIGISAQPGTIVTGNQVIFSTARKRWLGQTFSALAVEMETAAVAQVAVGHQVPWVAIRAISDLADEDSALDLDRLRFYLDGDRPWWRHRIAQWWYLFSHPAAKRRLLDTKQGLALASKRAGRLVEAMLRA
jgi:adenosylhomocysteine nucleosidase